MKTVTSLSSKGFLALGVLALWASTADAAPECSVGEVREWPSGFVFREIKVSNDTDRTLVPPRVRLSFTGSVGVDQAWGAEAVLEGQSVTLSGNDYNASLAAGSTARLAFKGTGSPGTVSCVVLTDDLEAPIAEPQGDVSAPIAESQGDVPVPTAESQDDVSVPTAEPEVESSEPSEQVLSASPLRNQGPVIWRDEAIDAGSPGQSWRGVNDTRIVADCGDGRGQCLEVRYEPTQRGSDRLLAEVPIPSGTDYTLLYDIRFDENFEFVQGGKLPGLAPDVSTTGCLAQSPAAWSVRPMWRIGGAAQGYFYGQDRTNDCGDGALSSVGVFKPGQWQTVALRVKLNEGESSYDGEVTFTVDGQIVSSNENVRLRSRITDASRITRFFFNTFYGGSDPSWAPTQTTSARYDNFRVVSSASDARPVD